MPAPIEERLQLLEEQTAKLREQSAAPKEKDVWDKLSALSALISGVIIAGLGIWVNITLTNGQQHAQDAQAEATRSMEKAHNESIDKQAANALALQANQAEAALAFQKEQAKGQERLEELKMRQEREQAANALTQQKARDDAASKIETTRLENETIAQIEKEENPDFKEVLLAGLIKNDTERSVDFSKLQLEISANPNLRQLAAQNLKNQQKSPDAALRQAASKALAEVSISKRVQAIVNVFESGRQTRNYGTVISGSTAIGLIYGNFLTLNSGSLYIAIKSYCDTPGARDASKLAIFLPRIEAKDVTLSKDESFSAALKTAATDVTMQNVQDKVFDDLFWKPAQTRASDLGLKLPLSLAVLFDSYVQGGANTMIARTNEKSGGSPAQGVDERRWISTYADLRLAYLDRFHIPAMKARPQFFLDTIAKGNWDLDLPLTVQGVAITE